MSRARLLYRVALSGSLLLLLAAGVVALVAPSLRWSLALGFVGLAATGVASHLRQRLKHANDKALNAAAASRQQAAAAEGNERRERVMAELFRSTRQEILVGNQTAAALQSSVEASLRQQDKRWEELAGRLDRLVIDMHEERVHVRESAARDSANHEQNHERLRKQLIQLNNLIEQLPSTSGEYAAVRNHIAQATDAMPQLGSWALTSPVVVTVARQILTSERPSTVVELGSGASSSWVGLALRKSAAGGSAWSLDHLPEFAEATRRSLRNLGVQDLVTVLDAPLRETAVAGERFDWYTVAGIPDDIGPITMLIVDGPPARKDRFTRYPAFPILRDRLAPEAIVILDDTVRDEEVAIYERWIQENPGLTLEADLGKAVLLRWNPA